MSDSKLPLDPNAYLDAVRQGTLDNQSLFEELEKHGSHASCDICDAFYEEELGPPFEVFLIESNPQSVDARVIELTLSIISQWAFEVMAFDSYLSIALNPKSSRQTLDKAFEFMEDYATYGQFIHRGDDYFVEILAKIAAHPLCSDADLRDWIDHNHYMFGQFSQEGHDEVQDEDYESCEKCSHLFESAKTNNRRTL